MKRSERINVKLDEFKDEIPDFAKVGARVRVVFSEIPKNQINCDTGVIIAIKTRFFATPQLRVIRFNVILDDVYIKPKFVKINNIKECLIEKEQLRPIRR